MIDPKEIQLSERNRILVDKKILITIACLVDAIKYIRIGNDDSANEKIEIVEKYLTQIMSELTIKEKQE